jgi:hypothetical protein
MSDVADGSIADDRRHSLTRPEVSLAAAAAAARCRHTSGWSTDPWLPGAAGQSQQLASASRRTVARVAIAGAYGGVSPRGGPRSLAWRVTRAIGTCAARRAHPRKRADAPRQQRARATHLQPQPDPMETPCCRAEFPAAATVASGSAVQASSGQSRNRGGHSDVAMATWMGTGS